MKAFSLALFLLALTLPAPAQGPGKRDRRGPDRAPAVGTKIPKVSAKTPDGKETVALHKPERLTVLVFGSHT
ncbi:MAG: hypothetical protein HKN82_14150 [Akkermansiaceae bacterium]|nr:hypothetical protein [Akkermansiaceae bacterium]